MSDWISIKDKLPERGTVGRYLVYVENIANYHRLPDNTIIATWFMSDWDFAEWEYNSVTHWMPLPQKPESENEDAQDKVETREVEEYSVHIDSNDGYIAKIIAAYDLEDAKDKQ